MTQAQRSTVKAGYLLGGALGVPRFAAARTVQDLLLAGALTAAELSAVWFLERKAATLESDTAKWSEEEEARGQDESQLKASTDEFLRRQQLLDASVSEREAIERELEHDHLMADLKTLQGIATTSIRAGCQAAAARNAGGLGGVRRQDEDLANGDDQDE